MWRLWTTGFLAMAATCAIAAAAGDAPKRTYHGYRVYDVAVRDSSEASTLRRLLAARGLQVWGEDRRSVQVQASPRAWPPLERALNSTGLAYQLRIRDIQALIDLEAGENTNNTTTTGGGGGPQRRVLHRLGDAGDALMDDFRLDVYHTWEQIERLVRRVAARYPAQARLEVLGYTHERRPIQLLQLSADAAAPAHKPVMWVDCGIHAREWVSPAVCLYAVSRLLGPDRHQLQHYDWHILPVMNPDGYAYTHTHDRLWRKNRRPVNYCTGVDLNRNFAGRWGTFGVTFIECGHTFPGYKPFSERESRAVRDAVLREQGRMLSFNSIHSYGQLWLIPYGYSWLPSRHVRQQQAAGRAATQAIRRVHGARYRAGISSRLLYLDSGTSTDWAYDAGVPHTVAVEARDRGYHGFLLPARLILPTARELWAGLTAQAEYLRTPAVARRRRGRRPPARPPLR